MSIDTDQADAVINASQEFLENFKRLDSYGMPHKAAVDLYTLRILMDTDVDPELYPFIDLTFSQAYILLAYYFGSQEHLDVYGQPIDSPSSPPRLKTQTELYQYLVLKALNIFVEKSTRAARNFQEPNEIKSALYKAFIEDGRSSLDDSRSTDVSKILRSVFRFECSSCPIRATYFFPAFNEHDKIQYSEENDQKLREKAETLLKDRKVRDLIKSFKVKFEGNDREKITDLEVDAILTAIKARNLDISSEGIKEILRFIHLRPSGAVRYTFTRCTSDEICLKFFQERISDLERWIEAERRVDTMLKKAKGRVLSYQSVSALERRESTGDNVIEKIEVDRNNHIINVHVRYLSDMSDEFIMRREFEIDGVEVSFLTYKEDDYDTGSRILNILSSVNPAHILKTDANSKRVAKRDFYIWFAALSFVLDSLESSDLNLEWFRGLHREYITALEEGDEEKALRIKYVFVQTVKDVASKFNKQLLNPET